MNPIIDELPNLSNLEPEQAAKTLYQHLRGEAERLGMKPDIEVGIYSPAERQDMSGNNWWVMWEAGPHNWAITYTLDGRDRTYAKNWFAETYWGFDIMFVEER